MKEIDLSIRKEGEYYWVCSDAVKGLNVGGNDLSIILSEIPAIIDDLVALNDLEPLQDWSET